MGHGPCTRFASSFTRLKTIPIIQMSGADQITETLSKLSVEDSEVLEELISSARYGELEEIQAVVNASPEKAKVLLAHQGEFGKTPLHMAAANGHLDIVEYLITIITPESVNIQNEQGNTALHWAATNGHAKVVETLITKGKADYKLKNAAGHTAMLEAEIAEREQVVAWMLINTEPEEELQQANDDDEDEEESEDEDDEEEAPAAGSSSTSA